MRSLTQELKGKQAQLQDMRNGIQSKLGSAEPQPLAQLRADLRAEKKFNSTIKGLQIKTIEADTAKLSLLKQKSVLDQKVKELRQELERREAEARQTQKQARQQLDEAARRFEAEFEDLHSRIERVRDELEKHRQYKIKFEFVEKDHKGSANRSSPGQTEGRAQAATRGDRRVQRASPDGAGPQPPVGSEGREDGDGKGLDGEGGDESGTRDAEGARAAAKAQRRGRLDAREALGLGTGAGPGQGRDARAERQGRDLDSRESQGAGESAEEGPRRKGSGAEGLRGPGQEERAAQSEAGAAGKAARNQPAGVREEESRHAAQELTGRGATRTAE